MTLRWLLKTTRVDLWASTKTREPQATVAGLIKGQAGGIEWVFPPGKRIDIPPNGNAGKSSTWKCQTCIVADLKIEYSKILGLDLEY